MTISIDCRFIGKSGIGTFIEGVARSLISEHPEHNYLLIVEKKIAELSGCANVRQIVTDIHPFTLKEMFCFPLKDINKTDAYFSPYINIPMGIKVPVYSTIHDVIFWDMPELVSKMGLWMRTFFVRHAISASKAIITVSDFSRKRIVKHFNTKKDIVVVPNGIADHIRNYNGSSEKENCILFVGNVKQHKGLGVLIEAYQKAKVKGLTSHLKIVGDKEKFRTSDSSVQDQSLADDSILFTGRLSNEELASTIASSKVLVLPSFYEGFGIPPMEALYLGTKAIVSDIDVLKEVYSDLPVTFFKCGDSSDLCEKLLAIDDMPTLPADIRIIVDSKYNYDLAAEKILGVIKA